MHTGAAWEATTRCAQIWRLPQNLSKVRKGEIALLRKVAASDDVMEALNPGA